MSTPSTADQSQTRGQGPIVAAIIAVIAVLLGGTFWVLRDRGDAKPVEPSPSATQPTPTESTATASASAATATPDPTTPPGSLPVYRISFEVSNDPASGLGLRRIWKAQSSSENLEGRVGTAVTNAMAGTDGPPIGDPWAGATLTRATVAKDSITLHLGSVPSKRADAEVEALAVQAAVWTAQAVVARGNLPVRFDLPDGSELFGKPESTTYLRPPRDEQYQVLTDVWITRPAAPDGGVNALPAGAPLTVEGEASVFEASVAWVIRADGSGTDIVTGHTMASIGAPGRGTYAFSVPTSELEVGKTYVVTVFAGSPKDGSVIADDSTRFRIAR